MLEDHAIIQREGFRVPLIGVPCDAVLEECDLCHEEKGIMEIQFSDCGQLLCKKCLEIGKPSVTLTVRFL